MPLVNLLHSYLICFFIVDLFLEVYLINCSETDEIEPYENNLVVNVDISYVVQYFAM